MYNKKYILEKIEEFNGHNDIYDDMQGSVCYLAYFNIGERGWFLQETGFDMAHRIHTSIVKGITYYQSVELYQNVELSSNYITVETNNTKLIFREIKD